MDQKKTLTAVVAGVVIIIAVVALMMMKKPSATVNPSEQPDMQKYQSEAYKSMQEQAAKNQQQRRGGPGMPGRSGPPGGMPGGR